MRSNGFFTGSIPSTNTCNHTETRTLYLRGTTTNIRQVSDQMLAWLTEGCPVVFLFEGVSRPHREEKRLRRLLKLRGTGWFRFLMLLSVRADTCNGENVKVWRCSSACFFNVLYIGLLFLLVCIYRFLVLPSIYTLNMFNHSSPSVTNHTIKGRQFWYFWVKLLGYK